MTQFFSIYTLFFSFLCVCVDFLHLLLEFPFAFAFGYNIILGPHLFLFAIVHRPVGDQQPESHACLQQSGPNYIISGTHLQKHIGTWISHLPFYAFRWV